MASFDLGWAYLFGNEGSELLDDPQTGEYSRYGVTLKLAEALHLCEAGDKAFIHDLTAEKAQAIYRAAFWLPVLLDGFASQSIANKTFDMAVNMGIPRAVKIAQAALNDLGAAVPVDGAMGPHTLTAVNAADPALLLTELRADSLGFYHGLVEKDPAKYGKYWNTWKARAEK